MKTIFSITTLALLLAVCPSRSFAMMSIAFVSKGRAKELGIEIRATANGPNEAWIVLEFKPEGQLKEFSHVSLEIRDGEKFLLGYTPLQEKKTTSGSITTSLMANRIFLEKVTLSIVVGYPGNYAGYELRVKDFVDLKNLSDKPPKERSSTNTESDRLPASPRK